MEVTAEVLWGVARNRQEGQAGGRERGAHLLAAQLSRNKDKQPKKASLTWPEQVIKLSKTPKTFDPFRFQTMTT